MTSLVVIPQNYEDLPEAQREQIIPICMAARDRKGQLIEPRWFFEGVAPVRKHLVSLAHYALGDPWCVSELAEATVHRLWSRYGASVGRCPWRRVLKKAIWMAEELRIGDWRKRKYPNLYLGLDSLDQKIREQVLVDPSTYVDLLEQQIMLDSIEERLKQEGRGGNARRFPVAPPRLFLAGDRRAYRRERTGAGEAPLLSLAEENCN